MDLYELLLKILIEQTTKKAIDFIPQQFRRMFGDVSPGILVRNLLSGYFFREDFVKLLLFSQDWSAKMGRTDFIDYDIYKNYYPDDKQHISLRFGEQEKEFVLPFKEEINFVSQPKAQILVKGIKSYSMLSELEKLTAPNLQRFLAVKPNTFDGPNLRLASLIKTSKNNYECELEYASYFSQIRTNLSADFRLQNGRFPSMRLLDMGANKRLKPLGQSAMLNTIGTSAIVYFYKGEYAYFFMKLRKQLGIYENMFGTTSGEVENPPQDSKITELTSFVSEEMKREFSYETGLNSTKVIQSIRPLALTRDLIRGGKPQFFFLIQIREVSKKEFSSKFKKSIEGPDEFHNDIIHNLRSLNIMSPEFAMNLIYALQALMSAKRFEIVPLNLDHRIG